MAGPMEGVRVLDLSQVISGPMAAQWLCDQGAEVIKVEDPQTGDLCRWLGPRKADIASLFLTANRGKRSIVIDAKKPEGTEALRELVKWADVLIQNFRPGAIERLGFSYEACAALNPRLIYAAISGYGQTGPYSRTRVYDPIIQASSGMAASQRDITSGDPTLIQTLVCDKLTALTAAQAITAALFAREKSGIGQRIELSMLDASVAFLWPEGMYNHTFLEDAPPPQPDFGAFYRLWKGKGAFFAIAAVQDKEFAAVCRGVGRPDLIEDPRFKTANDRMQNAHLYRQELTQTIGEADPDEIIAGLLREEAPAARLNERTDLPTDPQIVHNGTIFEMDHADLGRIRQPRHPAMFSGTPVDKPGLAPHLGQHTQEILSEIKERQK
jgi:crotonobetainyl-CoA:carnitine CoA-transferase CaiB-like acyl-CoA transferase